MYTKIIRHRGALLAGVLVVAVVLAVLRQRKNLLVSEACVALLGILVLGLLVASLIARHPATFLVRDGGFTTPPDANIVLTAAMLTVVAVMNGGFTAEWTHLGFGFRPDPFDIVLLVLMSLLLPLLWCRVLGPFGVVLRPEGLLDRQPFGTLFVPWEAGPTAEPTAVGVKLRFARPELVMRRGFRPGTSIRTGADRGFTAWAINLYAMQPDYRPTIGTDEGLSLLQPR